MPPKISCTACPCARLLKVPLMKPRLVLFTSLKLVPGAGAKFRVIGPMAIPVVLNPSLVTPMSVALLNVGVKTAPVPVIVTSKGFLLPSLLMIERDAVLAPVVTGAKRRVKVVLPPGTTGEAGVEVTVKSAASVPPTATLGVPPRVRSAEPVFLIVKTKSAVLPTTT